jgi:hypothetical protein
MPKISNEDAKAYISPIQRLMFSGVRVHRAHKQRTKVVTMSTMDAQDLSEVLKAQIASDGETCFSLTSEFR